MKNARKRRSTPGGSLVPLLVLTASLIYLLGGCTLTTPFAARLLTPEQKRRIVDESINGAIAALNRGDTILADGALARAVAFLGDAGYTEIGRRLTDAGRPADVTRLLEPATKREGANWDPVLWATLAEAAAKSGDTEGAARYRAEAARRAEEIEKTAGKVQPGQNREALTAMVRFLQAGVYYSDLGRDPKRAINAYREAQRLQPEHPGVLNNLGYLLADQGTTAEEYEEAVALTRRAVEAVPGEPVFLDSFGWALFKRGNAAKNDLQVARRVLREAVDMAPDIPELRYHLGVVYGQLGLTRDAEIELERALRLRPNYREAQEARARLKTAPGMGVLRGA
jgi:hypothetical protein